MMLPRVLLFLSVVVGLAACAGVPVTNTVEPPKSSEDRRIEAQGKLGGGDGLLNELLRGDSNTEGQGIDVNAYLWQASLDTLSFMPLLNADSSGGIIVTDWYRPSADAESRYKLNVYILGRELRANTLRVASFKQVRQGQEWLDSGDNPILNRQLEDAILTRARQMRVDATALSE